MTRAAEFAEQFLAADQCVSMAGGWKNEAPLFHHPGRALHALCAMRAPWRARGEEVMNHFDWLVDVEQVSGFVL